MSDDKSTHLIGILKNLIKDHGMPRTLDDITDTDFRTLAVAHIDEFDEARGECESDLTLI
jgi:hypothetical protein